MAKAKQEDDEPKGMNINLPLKLHDAFKAASAANGDNTQSGRKFSSPGQHNNAGDH